MNMEELTKMWCKNNSLEDSREYTRDTLSVVCSLSIYTAQKYVLVNICVQVTDRSILE